MALTDEVRHRIARKILVHKMAQEDFAAKMGSMKRELPNAAKNMGEDFKDLDAFVKEILPEVLAHKIGCKAVIIDW